MYSVKNSELTDVDVLKILEDVELVRVFVHVANKLVVAVYLCTTTLRPMILMTGL